MYHADMQSSNFSKLNFNIVQWCNLEVDSYEKNKLM